MGLADRHYMRGGSRSGPWSVTVTLMVTLTVIFALQCINDVYLKSFIEGKLALTVDWLRRGFLWQLLTFQFLHFSLLHLIGNLLGLWFFARFVENVLGRRRFLIAYLGCGVAGGILQGTLMILFPLHFGNVLFGASAGVLGLVAIFVRLIPGGEIRAYFLFPIPGKVLLLITGGISLFFTLVPSEKGGNAAHAAHLGGLIAGLAWYQLGWHHDFVSLPWDGWWKRLRSGMRRPAAPRPGRAKTAKGSASKPERPANVPEEEFISREVDPILDKIHAHGIHSLTEQERRILERARSKMGKR